MTTEPNRKLTTISVQAHTHMEKIVAAYKRRGVPESNTHWLSELILSQPIPTNGNGKAHGGAKVKAEGIEMSAEVEG